MCIVHGKTVDDAVQYTGRRHAGQQHDQVWLQSGEEWFWPGLESANVASLNNNYAVSDQLILFNLESKILIFKVWEDKDQKI